MLIDFRKWTKKLCKYINELIKLFNVYKFNLISYLMLTVNYQYLLGLRSKI